MAAGGGDGGRPDGVLSHVQAQGFGYGPAFQGLVEAWRVGEWCTGARCCRRGVGTAGDYGIHPALLDAALHLLGWRRL